MNRPTTYYHQPKLQRSALDLPLWVEQKIYASDDVEEEGGVKAEL